MKFIFLFVLCGFSWAGNLTELKAFDFSISVEMKYAIPNNPSLKSWYPFAECYLEQKTVEALSRVQTALKMDGFGLKVWDCYRPPEVQEKLERVMPQRLKPLDLKSLYEGNRVQLTLVDRAGQEVRMPTPGFYLPKDPKADKFEKRVGTQNKRRLDKAMSREGFVSTELWWAYRRPCDDCEVFNRTLDDLHRSSLPKSNSDTPDK